MIIEQIVMTNWGPYKGKHVLDLGPSIYAVIARDEADPSRSNWIGKTWLLSAPYFALFGVKPRGARTEDDWITHGESEGGIELRLSDGTSVSRTRRRGKSTQLLVTVPDNGGEAKQEAAQQKITELLGMSAEEFQTSCLVMQKQIDRLVTMDPAPRTKMVGEWIGLGPLRAAEDVARGRLARLIESDSDLERQLGNLRARIEALPGRADLEAKIAVLEPAQASDELRLAELESKLVELGEWRRHAEASAKMEGVIRDGQELRARLEAEQAPDIDRIAQLEQLIADAEVEKRERGVEVERLAKLITGKFDGVCPVIKEACPASDQVVAFGRRAAAAHGDAQRRCQEALEGVRRLRFERDEIASKASARVDDERRLGRLRERAREMLPSRDYIAEKGAPPEEAEIRSETASLRDGCARSRVEVVGLRRDLSALEGWEAEVASIERHRAELGKEIRTWREAVTVLGRNGAQREIAVDELAEIEEGANALLADADVDLRVSVSWGLEGKDPAKVCERCGAAFPASRKVKECKACGELRGLHTIERLDLVPSSISGAAEDLTGLSFQLSVAAWLRARRETDWSTVFVDEAFAACDKANGRALANKLSAMIRGRYSFEQGLVVAHDAELMEALPSRIQVTRLVSGDLQVEVSG